MPSGKIRFFDEEKGFGFISGADGQQVYVHASAVQDPSTLYPGAKVEYSVVDGRRGPQALSVSAVETGRVPRRPRKPADDMAIIVEDLVKVLDAAGSRLKQGQYPDRAQARKLSQMLRHVAGEFDA